MQTNHRSLERRITTTSIPNVSNLGWVVETSQGRSGGWLTPILRYSNEELALVCYRHCAWTIWFRCCYCSTSALCLCTARGRRKKHKNRKRQTHMDPAKNATAHNHVVPPRMVLATMNPRSMTKRLSRTPLFLLDQHSLADRLQFLLSIVTKNTSNLWTPYPPSINKEEVSENSTEQFTPEASIKNTSLY